jgi:hypothetical protein
MDEFAKRLATLTPGMNNSFLFTPQNTKLNLFKNFLLFRIFWG